MVFVLLKILGCKDYVVKYKPFNFSQEKPVTITRSFDVCIIFNSSCWCIWQENQPIARGFKHSKCCPLDFSLDNSCYGHLSFTKLAACCIWARNRFPFPQIDRGCTSQHAISKFTHEMLDYKTYIADGSDEGARGISHVQVWSSSSAWAIHFWWVQ